MKKIKCRFNTEWVIAAGLLYFFIIPSVFSAEPAASPKKNETGFYKDLFDQNFYQEGTNQLDLGRWGRKLFRKKIPSADITVFDEILDSSFFNRRQGYAKLSLKELERGSAETEGPDLSQKLTVIRNEQNGLYPKLWVEDARGDRYTLQFDPISNLELTTAAEVIASRFYHAIGYNVPQYTILLFRPDQIRVAADAVSDEETGFRKPLTQELLEKHLSFLPQTQEGFYRASACKVFEGVSQGSFSFDSKRKKDPTDPFYHRDRREIRALGIFSAWLNQNDLREGNTLELRTSENGKEIVTRYLTNFRSALGASGENVKAPMDGYEHLVDYGETAKAILSLGFWEKPWQKKWKNAQNKNGFSPAVGYFNNIYFDPGKYKNQFPYEAFRSITRADALWAIKILLAFSNEDIRAMAKAGKYTRPEDETEIVKTLAERRDLIASYWLQRVNGLDRFDLSNGRLTFNDLAVERGFEKEENRAYDVKVFKTGEEKKQIGSLLVQGTSILIDPQWFSAAGEVKVEIRHVQKSAQNKLSPKIDIVLGQDNIQSILHED